MFIQWHFEFLFFKCHFRKIKSTIMGLKVMLTIKNGITCAHLPLDHLEPLLISVVIFPVILVFSFLTSVLQVSAQFLIAIAAT